jgi:hypothetical protein
MYRVLAGAAAIGLAALGLTSTALAGATVSSTCPSATVLIAAPTYTTTGEALVGSRGNVWAYATYTRQLQIYRVTTKADTYCATMRDTGTFTTVPGPSPGGKGTVIAGITGTLGRVLTTSSFSGRWRPEEPLTGPVGAYPPDVDWTDWYFDDVSGFGMPYWSLSARSPANGCWSSRTDNPNLGDIRST